MNILLVWPQIPSTYCNYTHTLQLIKRASVMPPVGLLTLASLIPSKHEVKLVDVNVEKLCSDDILWADLVCISAMIVQKESLNEIIKRCNEVAAPVVLGGPYATFSHDSIKNVKYFILGEAERTFPQFLKDFEQGTATDIYHDDEMIDMLYSPIPRYDLISHKSYASASLQISRGCVFNCEFCNIVEMFGRKVRTKSTSQVLNELNQLYLLGWRGGLFIADDNFTAISNVKQLLKDLACWQQERKYPFSFYTQVSINYLKDPELLDLLVDAGFDMLFIGIESPSLQVLQNIGKKQNTNISLVDTIKSVQEKGIEVIAGLIVGFDDDPEDIFEQQIAFVEAASIAKPLMGLLTALPGTRLQRRLSAEGRFIKESDGNHTHILDLNFEPKMDKEYLIKQYANTLRYFYTPKHYFDRCLGFLKQAHFTRQASSVVNAPLVLLRICLKQSTSFYKWDYFKFLLKVCLQKPCAIRQALHLAVVGHHYLMLTQEMMDPENTETPKKLSLRI